MKIIYQDNVVVLTKDDPKYDKHREKGAGILCHVFRIKKSDHFVIENIELHDGTKPLGGQDIEIDTHEKLIKFTLKERLGHYYHNPFKWNPNVPFIGLNSYIIEYALAGNYVIEVTKSSSEYLKQPRNGKPGIKSPRYIPPVSLKMAITNDWIDKNYDVFFKIFSIPIWATYTTLEAARKADTEGLGTHSVAESLLNY